MQEQEHIARHVRNETRTDPLTGSMSFEAFCGLTDAALRETGECGGMLGIMVLNVGRVKTVNGLLGYEAGDRLIAHAGRKLAAYAGEGRPLCRLHGDEFAVLLPELDGLGQLFSFVQGVQEMFQQPIRLGQHEWFVTASMGISLFPNDGSTVGELLRRAGIALRHAKEKGGNRHQIYHPEMPEVSLADLETEAALRHALDGDGGQLALYYQPIVRMSDHSLSGMEALLRWNRPGHRPVPFHDFIHAAERCGAVIPIGEWMLKESCRQHRLWKQTGFGAIPISVNLSVSQLYHPNFVKQVAQALEETGTEPECLTLEIAESEAVKHCRFIQETINRLKKHGVRLAIDDYGTGFASIGHLRNLRIDAIKIDRTLVREAAQDQTTESLLKALIDTAHCLKVDTVAEGVETIAQAERMRGIGCGFAQGYRFFPPLPPDGCAALLRGGSLKLESDS